MKISNNHYAQISVIVSSCVVVPNILWRDCTCCIRRGLLKVTLHNKNNNTKAKKNDAQGGCLRAFNHAIYPKAQNRIRLGTDVGHYNSQEIQTKLQASVGYLKALQKGSTNRIHGSTLGSNRLPHTQTQFLTG